MKYLIIFLVALASCKPCKQGAVIVLHDTLPPVIIHDTLPRIHDTLYIDASDSLKTALFIANYKIERVEYYLKIVDRNVSQSKYLRGWVKRAVQ